MDKLEKRLNSLKNSYEELPTTSNVDKIMDKIKQTEVKRKKKWMTQLPYVASFMGVLIIGSLLTIHLLSSQDRNPGSENPSKNPGETEPDVTEEVEQEEISEELIATKHKELKEFYNEQKEAFEENTNIANAEALPYIQEVKKLVEDTASPTYNKYKNRNDVVNTFEEWKLFVQDRFEMPKTDFDQLAEKVKQNEDVSSEVMDLIWKQQGLSEYFSTLSIANFGKYNEISTDLFEQAEKLNNLELKNPELLAFAKEIKGNGYQFFVHVEGEINLEINFQDYLDQYEKNINSTIADFVKLKTKRLLLEGSIDADWDELAERLIKLEEILVNYNGINKKLIKEEYNKHLDLYLNGSVNTWAFNPYNGKLERDLQASYEKFLTEHQGTETYKIINEYYNLLEEGNFNKEAVSNFEY